MGPVTPAQPLRPSSDGRAWGCTSRRLAAKRWVGRVGGGLSPSSPSFYLSSYSHFSMHRKRCLGNNKKLFVMMPTVALSPWSGLTSQAALGPGLSEAPPSPAQLQSGTPHAFLSLLASHRIPAGSVRAGAVPFSFLKNQLHCDLISYNKRHPF